MFSAALKTDLQQFLEILNLCGYEKYEHFSNFGNADFENLEKYIRNYCEPLSMKERLKYMNKSFAKNPQVFTFNPLLKHELTKLSQIIEGQLSLNRIMGTTGIYSGLLNFGNLSSMIPNMTMQPVNNNFAIQDRILSEIHDPTDETVEEIDESPIDNVFFTNEISIVSEKLNSPVKDNKPTSKISLKPKPIKIQEIGNNSLNSESLNASVPDICDSSLTLADKNLHDLMVKFAADKLDCNLQMNIDFNIYTSVLDNDLGYFICKLCPINKRRKFRFNNNRSPVFWNLVPHLRCHFSSAEIDRSNKAAKFDLDSVELLKEDHHEYVTQMAGKTFKLCNLKAKKDFSLYVSKEDKRIGYLLCGLCSKSSPNGNHFKFRLTMYDSINFTNIKAHLHHHFELASDKGRKRKIKND